jgi:hypothetical protein
MIDATVPVSPEAPAQSTGKKKRRRNQPGLNQAQLVELTKAEQIVMAARKTIYRALLQAREITNAFLNALDTDIGSARSKSAGALQFTVSKVVATVSEGDAEEALVTALQEVQAAAKQKYVRTNRVMLQGYFVGKDIAANRHTLEQVSAAFLEKLGTDTLPGMTPEKVGALGDLREAYVSANGDQTDEQSSATQERCGRNELVSSIVDRRIQIQLAADAQWPYRVAANEAARREFYLPLDRPFSPGK